MYVLDSLMLFEDVALVYPDLLAKKEGVVSMTAAGSCNWYGSVHATVSSCNITCLLTECKNLDGVSRNALQCQTTVLWGRQVMFTIAILKSNIYIYFFHP